MIKGKRGSSGGDDENLLPIIIYILLNVAFFVVMFLFVKSASTGAFVYEQAYSKQIALILDNSVPGSEIKLNFSEGIEIAKKNKFPLENTLKIDQLNNEVIVRLEGRDGYKYGFFSSNSFSYKFVEDTWIIVVGGKNEE